VTWFSAGISASCEEKELMSEVMNDSVKPEEDSEWFENFQTLAPKEARRGVSQFFYP
jgi:hypothetical protein